MYVVGVVAAIVVALKDMAQVWGRSMNLRSRGFYHAPAGSFHLFFFLFVATGEGSSF